MITNVVLSTVSSAIVNLVVRWWCSHNTEPGGGGGGEGSDTNVVQNKWYKRGTKVVVAGGWKAFISMENALTKYFASDTAVPCEQ